MLNFTRNRETARSLFLSPVPALLVQPRHFTWHILWIAPRPRSQVSSSPEVRMWGPPTAGVIDDFSVAPYPCAPPCIARPLSGGGLMILGPRPALFHRSVHFSWVDVTARGVPISCLKLSASRVALSWEIKKPRSAMSPVRIRRWTHGPRERAPMFVRDQRGLWGSHAPGSASLVRELRAERQTAPARGYVLQRPACQAQRPQDRGTF